MDSLFFIASKVIWAALRIDTLLLFLIAVGLLGLLRGKYRLAKGALFAAFISAVTISIFPVGDLLLRPLEQRYPAAPAVSDVTGILLLGGSEDVDPSRTWGPPQTNDAGDRVIAAAELARRFPEARVLVTGGGGTLTSSDLSEGAIAAQILLKLGVPSDRLLVEDQSRNTAENAALSLALLSGEGEGTWVLVTSAYHLPRAVATFCAAGWTDLVAWPTDYRSAHFSDTGWDFAQHLDELNLGVKEWVGLLAYRLTGRLNAETC